MLLVQHQALPPLLFLDFPLMSSFNRVFVHPGFSARAAEGHSLARGTPRAKSRPGKNGSFGCPAIAAASVVMIDDLQIDGISTRPAENHRPFSFNPTPAWRQLIKG